MCKGSQLAHPAFHQRARRIIEGRAAIPAFVPGTTDVPAGIDEDMPETGPEPLHHEGMIVREPQPVDDDPIRVRRPCGGPCAEPALAPGGVDLVAELLAVEPVPGKPPLRQQIVQRQAEAGIGEAPSPRARARVVFPAAIGPLTPTAIEGRPFPSLGMMSGGSSSVPSASVIPAKWNVPTRAEVMASSSSWVTSSVS